MSKKTSEQVSATKVGDKEMMAIHIKVLYALNEIVKRAGGVLLAYLTLSLNACFFGYVILGGAYSDLEPAKFFVNVFLPLVVFFALSIYFYQIAKKGAENGSV
jgi:hypothetical protein